MAIRRVSATLARTQDRPYTTLLNSTVELIKSPDALAIYTYLQTKNERWIVRREDVMERFGIGKHRYTEAMQHLRSLGLVERIVTRDEKGQVTDNQLIIHYQPPEDHRMPYHPDTGSIGKPDDLDSGESGHLETDQSFNNESIDTNNSIGTSDDAPCDRTGNDCLQVPVVNSQLTPEQPVSGSGKPNKSKSDYPPEFEWIWSHKPERAGGNGKKSAYNACRARIKSGATWRELAEGLKRYHTHCTAEGKIGTPYVMQMATFFGSDEHYKNDWKIGATNGRSTQQRNSGDEFIAALQSTDWANDFGKTPFDDDFTDPTDGTRQAHGELVDDGDYPDFPEVAGAVRHSGGSGRGAPGVAHNAGGAGRDE